MHKIILMILISLVLVSGDVLYALPDTAKNAEMIVPEIKAKMDSHIEKVKLKNTVKYQIMMERANNTITGCLSCHIDLVENKKNRIR